METHVKTYVTLQLKKYLTRKLYFQMKEKFYQIGGIPNM